MHNNSVSTLMQVAIDYLAVIKQEHTLKIAAVASTLMMCEPQAMENDRYVIRALESSKIPHSRATTELLNQQGQVVLKARRPRRLCSVQIATISAPYFCAFRLTLNHKSAPNLPAFVVLVCTMLCNAVLVTP